MTQRRALHYVFKIGNRTATANFYREILGMKFLRHEEFEKGCEATCNGPYDGKWSKSMVGYGSEDSHFVVELTYNYGIGSYRNGNDFLGLTVQSDQVIANAKKNNYPVGEEGGSPVLISPGGYKFKIVNKPSSGDPVIQVSIAASNLAKSVDYWTRLCGMKVYDQSEKKAVLGYADNQCKLELVRSDQPIDRGTAFGRVAFSCPASELPGIEEKMKQENQTVITPLVTLPTPGKADVTVVILGDPDGHEICFVGDEAFRELSQTDPKAEELLDQGIAADKSDEWYAKKGKTKSAAE